MSTIRKLVRDAVVDAAGMLLVGRVGADILAADVDRVLRRVTPKPLRITLRTSGGDILEAHRIYNSLREYAGKFPMTICCAQAFSSGAMLLLAADDRIVARNGTVMLHNVGTTMTGEFRTSGQLRDLAASLDGISTIVTQIIGERTGLDPAKVAELMESETHLNAEKAVELGFATEICDPIF